MKPNVNDIAQALFVINRHAKTALDPTALYSLKKQAIDKLLIDKHAKKVGLQYSKRPKLSCQHSTLLVKVGEYYFHIPPTKKDFKTFDHLGELDQNFRNPQVKMSLKQAKQLITQYLGIKEPLSSTNKKSSYMPSLLGRWNYAYHKQDKRY
ncbi:hypothetical protein GCM10012290_20730 [Halolactibacillus alkaliphilus]|uniref:YkyB-like protein n=1 Tax=Halolactibacillus alkaliphilus TaxID=442899 RepID=A0A511X3K2_9BACI|nr:YkyB family protein [Halolactibacillus alkaliphilus]GEN57522.1 hypothetical protein HAL01_19860 [Halolactibacillus alkaliphilus]GGN73653.1 hypothetical protein GCM10012290_20730 [Halolactibacillus alkaliphilus]SFO97932.1 YkyB-like protein [Halolactibacillus alkaliphilus]